MRNKYAKYDIENGLKSLKVGLLSILEDIPNIKEYTLDIPYLNVDIITGVINYIKSKDKVENIGCITNRKDAISIKYFKYTIVVNIYEDKITFSILE